MAQERPGDPPRKPPTWTALGLIVASVVAIYGFEPMEDILVQFLVLLLSPGVLNSENAPDIVALAAIFAFLLAVKRWIVHCFLKSFRELFEQS